MTTKKETDIAITKTYDLAKPVEAMQMAKILKDIIVQQKLFVNIKGKNYAMVEGWQLAGFLGGVSVIVDEPKNLSTDKEIKYSSKATLYKDEKIVGVGYAVCSSKEIIKKSFEEYAILSMAQTRSIGKAYRNKIGFILKLAGFSPTPSEEMHKVGETIYENKSDVIDESSQVPKFVCSKCDMPISQQVNDYSKKVYKKPYCRDCQKDIKK